MDRRLPPRVTYWTGTWDPAKEAISKEINALRIGSRARAPVVAFSPANRTRLIAKDRALTLSAQRWLAFRGVAAFLEPRGDLTHIFGGVASSHLISSLGRRPIVLTAVYSGNGTDRLPHRNVARVVVETESAVDEWLRVGIPRERIEIIEPGIDLEWYRPQPAAPGSFTLLFASTPSDAKEISERGIPLLVDLARLCPDVQILVPWRQWGDVGAARRALAALSPPRNFIVEHGASADMRSYYARAHATIVCFAGAAGKSSPNFVLEGFASGRPCLSTAASLADMLDRTGAGITAERTATSLCAAVEKIRRDWAGFAERARRSAEERFDLQRFRAQYETVYRDISSEPRR